MRKIFITILCAAAACSVSFASTDFSRKQADNRKTVDEINADWQERFEGREDCLVLRSLFADRKEKKVVFLAESTDIETGAAVEFFVIGENSGHDYEALVKSFASPADIKKALEFTGMTAGSPVDFQNNRFWPKGERVKMHVAFNSTPAKLTPIEKYVFDDRTGKTLPGVGLAFTGSTMIKNAEGEMVLAVDAREPQSIASTYNEPETLLDIPYQGNQDALYDHLHTHKGTLLPTNELLRIVLEPEYKDGTKRVCDLALEVAAPEDTVSSISNYLFAVTGSDGELLNENKTLKAAIEIFSERNKADKDLFVALSFADNVPAAQASQVCRLIQSMEAAGSLRLSPPKDGQLYYRAFIPNPAYLDRETRGGHPWELRLKHDKKKAAGTMTHCEFVWTGDAQNPEIKTADYEVTSPEKMRKTIIKINKQRKAEDKQPNIPVILVVTPGDMTFGKIMDFIKPILDIVPIVHIYAQQNE